MTIFGLTVPIYAGTFFDDFNDGNADGWIFPYEPSRSQGPGLWSVENGTLVQRFFGDGNAGLVDNLFISDQVIETQVSTLGYAGIVLWYQVNKYVAVNLNRASGIWVHEQMGETGYGYPYNYWIGGDTWYDLRVEANSATGELAVYLNDVYLFTHLASTPYRTGLSGIWSGNEVGNFDNFRLTSNDIPSIPIAIDIKPGSSPNSIDPKSKGKIPVAILSTQEFYAPDMVNQDSLTFGFTGDEDSLAFCNPKGEDVDGDGLRDLVCHFYTQDAGFQCGDTEGILKGETVDGKPFEGSDSVRIIPCNN